MVEPIIRVCPAPALRRAFAAWAVRQRPKVRTVGATEFAVPAEMFTHAPEELLLGAVVDGHMYVPVADASGEELPQADATEALREPAAPAVPDGLDGRMSPVRDSTPTTDTVPDTEADSAPDTAVTSEDTHTDTGVDAADTESGHVCPHADCGRQLKTAKGLTAHLRQAHEGSADAS